MRDLLADGYMGRRARKAVYNQGGGVWSETADLLFVYDNWNVVMVLDANETRKETGTGRNREQS